MDVKRILIRHFSSLDNYGTAMMGLVVSQFLSDHFRGEVEIHTDSKTDEIVSEVAGELRGPVRMQRYVSSYAHRFERSGRLAGLFWRVVSAREYRKFDLVVILGGDDISEYYSRYGALKESMHLRLQRFFCPIVLLGQTIGPFRLFLNRFFLRRSLRPITVITRDQWCYEYLRDELNLKKNLHQGADLAFCDLPLQHNDSIRQEILERYRLVPNQYVTVIVSALSRVYCNDREVYFRNWRETICRLAANPFLHEKKICLLAHTFANHGDEGEQIAELYQTLPKEAQQRIVLVTERILPARARFLLGEGYLTITGRMHASISTFQVGKPAIVLSYSKKYDGIIGGNLNRPDLIIDAREETGLWERNRIADAIDKKIRYLCEKYDKISYEIRERVSVQKQLAESMLKTCVEFAR